MTRKYNILIVYAMYHFPMRRTLWDALYSFRRYSTHNCFYLNLSARSVPRYIKRVKFDLIIFGTVFLANRVVAEWFAPLLEKARALKTLNAVKVILPQDEHSHADALCDFIREFDINCVFSVGMKSEWPKIYRDIDFERVKIFNVLTGYLDDATTKKISRLAKSRPGRDIDIGYRTFRAAPNLGRHGFLRTRIAEVFRERAVPFGLVTDISLRKEDTLWGDEWYKFLLRCKYTISVEGGSSVLDRDGTIQRKTDDYLMHHPEAGFEEVERACFAGLDGKLNFFALSPRHLEACATRTCQVLVEGAYNGVLAPGRHYIELKRDFRNLEEVLAALKRDDLRSGIVERAYHDIVESGRYTYQSFVDFLLAESLVNSPAQQLSRQQAFLGFIVYYWMWLSDVLSWIQVALHMDNFRQRAKGQTRRALVAIFSEESVAHLLGRARGIKSRRTIP